MVAIPKSLLDVLSLSANRKVGLSIEGTRLIIEPMPKGRYALEELIADCDPTAALSEEGRQWLNAPAVGLDARDRTRQYLSRPSQSGQSERRGARRYILVVRAFNAVGTPLICPITQGGGFARNAGFAVSLIGSGTKTQGVVLCNQPRVLDLQARGATFVKKDTTSSSMTFWPSCKP